MIETRPQEAVAEGGDLGRDEAVQNLNRAAVSARSYNWDD